MTNCIICNHDIAEHLYEGIDRCKNCGHVFADMSLTNDALFKIYQKDYFFGEEYSDYVADKRIAQKNFALRLTDPQAVLASRTSSLAV